MIRRIIIAAFLISLGFGLGHYTWQTIIYVNSPQCEWCMAAINKQEGKNVN